MNRLPLCRGPRSLGFALLVLAVAWPHTAFGTKFLVFKPRAAQGPSPVALGTVDLDRYRSLGVEVIAEYSHFYLVEAPKGRHSDFVSDATANGLVVQAKDSYDLIQVNGYIFPSSQPAPSLPPDLTIDDYPAASEGLYLVQMVGPNRPEWWAEMTAVGSPVGYLPENTYVLRGRGEDVRSLAARKGFQHVSAFQPAYKVAPALLQGEAPTLAIIQLDGGGPLRRIGDVLDALAGNHVEFEQEGPVRNAALHLAPIDVRTLAALPEVVHIEPLSPPAPSDERVALSGAGRYAGGQPTNPGTYQSWLASKGFCTSTSRPPGCYDYWTKVAVFDSGIDSTLCPTSDPACPGGTRLQSPDFGSRVVRLYCANSRSGTNYCFDAANNRYDYSDRCGHGTAVASVLAGDPVAPGGVGALGRDLGQFYLGSGVAPLAQVMAFKLWGDNCTLMGNPQTWPTPADLERWIGQLPAYPTSRFASHSWNNYKDYTYNAYSQKFDALVRDANGGFDDYSHPMTIVFSAGNLPASATADVVAPANGKNVLSAGAAESYRTSDVAPWNNGSICKAADSLNNVADFSNRGVYSNPNRLKPDLLAPATRVGVAWSRANWPSSGCYQPPSAGDPNGRYYTRFWGTSSAAPAVTGSAVLAETWFSSRQGGALPSPAMLRAMLVAHTDDMHGGTDRMTGTTLQHYPMYAKGWGRVNLDRLFQTSVSVKYYDEDHSSGGARRFTPGEGSWTVNLQVANSSKDTIAVLVFTDRFATAGASSLYVNNLDLYVLDGSYVYSENNFNAAGYTIQAYSGAYPDFDNTVKVIRIPAGQIVNGDFTIEVVPSAINMQAVPGRDGISANQDFALYVYNAL